MLISNGKTIEELQEHYGKLIDAQAEVVILRKYPMWKQINLLYAAFVNATNGQNDPLIHETFTYINKIRLMSNIAKENLTNATTPLEAREVLKIFTESLL